MDPVEKAVSKVQQCPQLFPRALHQVEQEDAHGALFVSMSYAEAFPKNDGTKALEATMGERRLLFAGFVMRVRDDGLPKRVMLGTLGAGGKG